MILLASSLKPKSLAARRVASECQKLSNPAAGEASTAHSMSSTTSFRNITGILSCSVAKHSGIGPQPKTFHRKAPPPVGRIEQSVTRRDCQNCHKCQNCQN